MKRRPRRGIPAALAALLLFAAGALTAIVAIQLLLGERPWLSYDWAATSLHGLRWRDTAVLVAGIAAAALGVLAVAAAVIPGRPTVLPLRDNESGVDSGASRRGFTATLRNAAASVDGVASARLRLRRRGVRTSVRTNRVTTDGLDDAVSAAVTRRLAEIDPAADLTVRTRTATTRRAG